MSQTTLTTFFNSRKRPASDDIISSKNKIPHIERGTGQTRSVKKVILKKDCEISSLAVKPSTETTSNAETTTPKGQHVEASIDKKNATAFTKKTNAANVEKEKASNSVSTVQSARKELSLGDIKKKLAGSSRLAELRATADRLSKGIQDLKDKSESRNLKEFRSIKVDVPESPTKRSIQRNDLLSPKKTDKTSTQQSLFLSPRKVVVSPIKSPSKEPAYIRHASLASASTSLPLPHHYRFLAELFRSMEAVVALLYNRNEKVTFTKLKPSIQEMLKRNFTEKYLSQIKHLVPDFYNFEVQKGKSFSNSANKESYELVISPNFPNDIKIMNPSVLLERRRYFYNTLLQQVKKHHKQYLLTLDPPLDIPDSNLVRWHPEFELEKVPEVECAKLPEVPNAEKHSSAEDVLAKARELFKCNTKMERALEKLAHAKSRGLTEEEMAVTGLRDNSKVGNNATTQTNQPSASNITILNPALRNLPAALLEKVKAKQAAKALEAMTRSSENEQQYMIYSRLPDLARTLRNIFVTERKNVLALNVVLSKLDSSFKSNVSSTNLQKDIKILNECAPDLIKLHEIRNTTYIKLDKTVDLQKVVSMLEAKASQSKSE